MQRDHEMLVHNCAHFGMSFAILICSYKVLKFIMKDKLPALLSSIMVTFLIGVVYKIYEEPIDTQEYFRPIAFNLCGIIAALMSLVDELIINERKPQ